VLDRVSFLRAGQAWLPGAEPVRQEAGE